jgi:hypothetical protein
MKFSFRVPQQNCLQNIILVHKFNGEYMLQVGEGY